MAQHFIKKTKVKELGLELEVDLATEKVKHFLEKIHPSKGVWMVPRFENH